MNTAIERANYDRDIASLKAGARHGPVRLASFAVGLSVVQALGSGLGFMG